MSKKASTATALPIPDACLSSHIGIMGKTGSGKTYAAKAIAEKLIAEGRRVCVVDPTGAWWGLKRNAEGDGPPPHFAQPVVVLGGRHGDVTLAEGVGKALGKVVGEGSLPVSILDTGDLTVGARTRLFADFAEELYRVNRGPLWLFIDEAHNFAPQGSMHNPQSAAMLHAASALISGGRSRGIRVVLISQRPQKVHKDALTQVETLVMMRLIAPQDRKAIEEWVKEHDDAARGKEVLDSLAKLKVGEGWVWAPAVDDEAWMDATGGSGLVRAQWPRITTYDSSSTPDDDDEVPELECGGGVDLDALQALLGEAAEEITRDDPKALKAKIRELEAELTHARMTGDSDGLRGELKELRALHKALRFEYGEQRARWMMLRDGVKRLSQMSAMIDGAEASGDEDPSPPAAPDPLPQGEREAEPAPHPARRSVTKPAPAARVDGVSGPQGKILAALAWYEAVSGLDRIERAPLAFILGIRVTGSFSNNLGRLRTLGLIDYPSDGFVAFTDKGRKLTPKVERPSTLADLHGSWMGSLAVSGPQRAMLEVLIAKHPRAMTREALAGKLGIKETGSFSNNLGRLRTLGLVEYPEQKTARASDLLFPEGLR